MVSAKKKLSAWVISYHSSLVVSSDSTSPWEDDGSPSSERVRHIDGAENANGNDG